MSPFRTEIEIAEAAKPIGYDSKLLFIGSCFAENLGSFFKASRFNCLINPFGVLYNPLSLGQALELMMDNREFTKADLHFHNDMWHSFYHHSRFSHVNADECLSKMNADLKEGREFLEQTDYLFITLGTAWVYELIENQQIVANCHKYPTRHFNRFLTNPDELIERYKDLLVKLRVFNPGLQVIFTISPVRHWKDGAHGNQISKAVLLLATEKISELFDGVDYFPAYELLLDDLRDYRFYDVDMLHPGSLAIEYIREKFIAAWMNDEARRYLKDFDAIIKAKNHRPFNPASLAHQKFLLKNLDKIEQLMKKYPAINLNEDKADLEALLV